MAKRHVEVVVRRNGRQEDRQPAVLDVHDVEAMQTWLADWLEANHWPRRHWPDFVAEVRGDGKPVQVWVT